MKRAWPIAALGALVLLWCGWDATLDAPTPSRLLTDADGHYLGEISVPDDGRLGFWPAGTQRCSRHESGPDCLPHRMVEATLAIEDRRFDAHPGVDPIAIARAVKQNLASGERVSGASTLAMQVARLQRPGSRTWLRKASEAVRALSLVIRHGRSAVLAHYLRLAPYGNNVHGVRYAARRYFDKPLADLTWAEASLLAAIPQAPGRMNLYTADGRRRARARAGRILDQLHLDGQFGADALTAHHEELQRIHPGIRPTRPEATLLAVLAMDQMDLIADGPVLQTTLNLALQEQIERALLHQVLDWQDRGAGQAAAFVVDRRTMSVIADVGSIGFNGTRGGSIDFVRERRYPGSTLKPLLYTTALDQSVIQPGDILDDLRHGPEGIRNADGRFLGPLSPRVALANSRNVPAVHLAQRVGLPALFDMWRRLGLHEGQTPVEHYGLGVAIGGMPTRLLDLVTAIGALANDGVLRAPNWDGVEREGVAVFRADHARLVTDWLSDATARQPTFPRGGNLEFAHPVAVKTGTSPDFRDSWAVAWSDRHVIGIWVGHPDWRPMRKLSGYSGAGTLLASVLPLVEPDGAAPPAPPAGWSPRSLCPMTGGLATASCNAPHPEWWPDDLDPPAPCSAHSTDASGTVTDLPRRYDAWMEAIGTRQIRQTSSTQPARITILSPAADAHLVRDPTLPDALATVALVAEVTPADTPIVWWIDGEPYATAARGDTIRWPVSVGPHRIQARAAGRPERSSVVVLDVQ